MAIVLHEERNASRLLGWLQTEDEQTLEFIDAGFWGRPITVEAIERQWDDSWQKQFFQEYRSRELLWYGVFSAYLSSQTVGHIEVSVIQNIDDSFPEINPLYVGQVWAMLLNLYVIQGCRQLGYGTEIVKSACDIAFDKGAEVVVLIVGEENYRARRFYEKVGFVDTGLFVLRQGGTRFLIIEYRDVG